MGGTSLVSGDPLVWAAVTALRATLLLAGALGLGWLLRRTSAAVRHTLWTVTLCALLALPLLSLVVPQLPVPVPGGWIAAETAPAQPEPGPTAHSGAPLSGSGHSAGAPQPAVERPAAPLEGASGPIASDARSAEGGSPDGEASGTGSAVLAWVEAGRSSAPPPQARSAETESPMAGMTRRAGGWILLLWALGAGAAAVPLGLGLWRSTRLCRTARAARDPAWLRCLHRARARAGMERPVSLRFSFGVRTGMAGGLVRSIVLLPDTARAWDRTRREMVLLHELVHLRRRDPLRKVLGRVALALYWFHPLVWWAARSAALAREEACDEAVVALGHRRSVYARHLLDLADRERLPMPALAPFGRPPLEKRIMRLLNSRSASSTRTVALTAGVAVSWVVLVAALAPAAPDAQPDTSTRAEAPLPQRVVLPPPPASTSQTLPHALSASGRAVASPDTTDACRPRPGGPDFADGEDFGVRGTGVSVQESGEWFLQRSLEGMMLCLRAHGVGDPEALATGELDLPGGAWLVLAARGEGTSQRLAITPGPAGPVHAWSVDGEARPFDDEVQAWRDAMLEVMGTAAEMAVSNRDEVRLQEEMARARRQRADSVQEDLLRQQRRIEQELAQERYEYAATLQEAYRDQADAAEFERRSEWIRQARGANRDVRQLQAALSAMREVMERLEQEPARENLSLAITRTEQSLEELRERLDSARVVGTDTTLARIEAMESVREIERVSADSIRAVEARIQATRAERIARVEELRTSMARVDSARTAAERELDERRLRLDQAEARLLLLIRSMR